MSVGIVTGSAVQQVLNAVLTYHHGESGPSKDGHERRLVETINPWLSERFFEALYVPRPEVRDVVATMTIEPLTVVYGGRGAGKSTTIKFIEAAILSRSAVADEPPLDPVNLVASDDRPMALLGEVDSLIALAQTIRVDDAWLVYFDAEYHLQALKTSSVCEMLYDQYARLAEELLPDHLEQWAEYKRANYDPVVDAATRGKDLLHELRIAGIANVPDQIAIDIANDTAQALKSFDDEDATMRLRFLLGYLKAVHSLAPGVLLDNVDRLSSGVQLDVVTTLASFAYNEKILQGSVVGIREENLTGLSQAFRDVGGFRRADAVNATMKEPALPLLLKMLRKRCDVAEEALLLPQVQEILHQQLAEGALARTDPTRIDAASVVRVVSGFLTLSKPGERTRQDVSADEQKYFEQILRWHNYSLRSVLGSAYDLGKAISSGADAVYPYQTIRESVTGSDGDMEDLGKDLRRRIRFCRGLLIRHFVTQNLGTVSPQRSLLVLSKPDNPTPRGRLPYLRIHLLQLLQGRGPLTIDEIESLFDPYGVRRSRIESSLLDIGQATQVDERGLVHVDGRRVDRDKISSRHDIHLLPAGVLLLERLAYMTDYVFWNARFANRPSDIGPAELVAPGPTAMIEESFRIKLALAYLENRILPRYLEIWEMAPFNRRKRRSWTHEDYLSNYLDTFGNSLVPLRIAQEIRAFSREGREVPEPLKADVETRVAAIALRCRQPFVDCEIDGRLAK